MGQKVSLTQPYRQAYRGAPTDRMSIQYAVKAIVDQVGVSYDWERSYANTNPICRQWVRPRIVERPCGDALRQLLEPFGLTYGTYQGQVVLELEPGTRLSEHIPGEYGWYEEGELRSAVVLYADHSMRFGRKKIPQYRWEWTEEGLIIYFYSDRWLFNAPEPGVYEGSYKGPDTMKARRKITLVFHKPLD